MGGRADRRCRDARGAIHAAAALVAMLALAGCKGEDTGAASRPLPPIRALETMPTGPLAGVGVSAVRSTVHNPYNGNPTAIEEGHRLYIQMNCAYCHGFTGEGGMGPDLADNYWRFGGDDADVFLTIWGGRGKGMPAWQNLLSEDQIWKLIAYIRTLATQPPQVTSSRGGQTAARNAKQAMRQVAQHYQHVQREPLKGRSEYEP